MYDKRAMGLSIFFGHGHRANLKAACLQIGER
jgi:hypothetical protein